MKNFEVVMLVGCQGSGKSSLAQWDYGDYHYLNRDKEGGILSSLAVKFEQLLQNDKGIVLDNTHPTKAVRKPFIDLAKKYNVPIRCVYMDTSIEDAQINILHRMWKKHQRLFLGPDSQKEIKNDPHIFPISVLFKYRKEFEMPTVAEGFTSVETVKFTRQPFKQYNNKALILDYDDTLRYRVNPSEGEDRISYPLCPEEVAILPGRKEKLKEYKDKGYLLLGVSNQSGVHKGNLSFATAEACFDRTNELLGFDIDYLFCQHQSNPIVCYCRKPQSGHGVLLIHRYQLDPAQCIFVGDRTTDKTFAERLGFKYYDQAEFFN